MIFLLTGTSGSGKTTMLGELAEIFRNHKLVAGGFTAPGSWLGGKRSGFVLHDLYHKTNYPLAKTDKSGTNMQGRFVFDEKTLVRGNLLLQQQANGTMIDFIIVDEVGPFEFRGRGWAPSLDVLAKTEIPQIWSVRTDLVGIVPEHWGFRPAFVFSALTDKADMVFRKISETCIFPLR